MTIKKALEEKIVIFPNKILIRCNDETFTWLDIEKASQILANDLNKLGVKEGCRVGLSLPNSANWVIAFFAIYKLNAIPVLLSPNLRKGELETAINIGEIEYLCCNDFDKTYGEDGEGIKKLVKIHNLNNTNYKNRFDEYDVIKDLYGDENDDERLMLFTSGSTGKPKAVIYKTKNIIDNLAYHNTRTHLNEEDKHCLVLPLFHMFGLSLDFLSTIVSDGEIVIPESLKTSEIIKAVKKEKCTTLDTVPTLMIALLSNKDFKPEDFGSIKSSILGGSLATYSQISMFKEKMPNNHIMNLYGLTEGYVVSMTDYNDNIDNLANTVGKPYEGIDVQIQDFNTKRICNQNEKGEIIVKGYCNMDGYYGVEKNEQPIDENGYLHTGDLGYLNEDGYLCISGRIKEIIVRSGENIMPLEIASVIAKNKSIKDVKVIGIPDDFRGEEIVACVTLNEGCTFNEQETRELIDEHLSSYKMPKYFVVYDEFPKLGNGKVDAVQLKKELIDKFSH